CAEACAAGYHRVAAGDARCRAKPAAGDVSTLGRAAGRRRGIDPRQMDVPELCQRLRSRHRRRECSGTTVWPRHLHIRDGIEHRACGDTRHGGGLVLDLKGTVRPPAQGSPLTVELVGIGRSGTATYGWQYDYHAYLAH